MNITNSVKFHSADDRDRFHCLPLGDYMLRAVEEKGLNPFVRTCYTGYRQIHTVEDQAIF